MNIHDQKMQQFTSAGLYFVTSESLSKGRTTLEIVRCALLAGVKLIQLREKEMSTSRYLELARDVRRLTRPYNCLLIINDRLDVAIASEADGVHLGQDDLPISDARAIAPNMIIGASSHSAEEARQAEADGASYTNIGPLFPTQTKNWTADYLGIEGLQEISAEISIPFTVMGGIKKEHIADLRSAGANTIALVTAITAALNPLDAARELLNEINAHAPANT